MADPETRKNAALNRRPWALSLALLVVLAGLALVNRIAFDAWLARFDMFTFFVPWYAHLGARLREFDIPGWNPALFSGTPFAGDPESGWMYLPAMLSFTLLPVLAGFKALAALHLAIAGAGAWVLARSLGLGPAAALAAGLAYVLAPLLQWNSYCCLVMNQFAVWIPWVLLGLELGLRQPTWRGRIAPWSLAALAISQQFAGFVGQGWVLAPLLAAAWIAYRTLLDPARPAATLNARLADGIASGALSIPGGMLLGAAGILPRIEFNAQSNIPFGDYRAHGAQGILNPPWSVPHLLAQLMGDAYDRRSAAIGGATLVLALLAVPLARKRFATPFFAALALLSMVLALPPTPIHRVVYVIPGMRSFLEHDAWRIWVFVPIGFAMLAGIAVQALQERRGDLRAMLIAPIPLVLMLVAAWVVWPEEGFIGWLPLAAALLMTLAIVAWEADLRPGARWLPAVAVALIFLQPIGIDLSSSWLGWPRQESWDSRWRPDPVIRSTLDDEVTTTAASGAAAYLQRRMAIDGPFRYVGYGGLGFDGGAIGNYMGRRFEPGIHAILANGRPMFLGLRDMQGYNPLELGRYADFVSALNGRGQDYHTAYLLASGVSSPLLDLLDIRFVIIDRAIPDGREDIRLLQQGRTEVFRDDLVSVWERAPATRHTWIVHEARQATRDEALSMLASGLIDGATTALLESGPPDLAVPPAGIQSTAEVTRYDEDSLDIAVSAASSGMLVISEAYERGWKAAIDGQRVPIIPANGWMQAIAIPAGDHQVTLRYEPLSLVAGLWISALTALALTAGSIWSLAGRRDG